MGRVQKKSPSLDDWRRVYDVAAQVKAVEPWRYMDETDIFAVKDPASGGLGFVSVMGRAGEHLAVSFYLGSWGLYEFWTLQQTDCETYPESLFEAPQLQLSFEDRTQLDNHDRDVIKRLGLKFRGRGAWPMFRSFRPGYWPWYLEADELRFLTIGLEQLLDVAPRFKADQRLLENKDVESYFARVPVGRGGKKRWKDAHVVVPPPTDTTVAIPPCDDLLDACDQLGIVRGRFELDLFAVPVPIGERGTRPRLLYLLLLVEADTGFVMGFRTLTVDSSLLEMWVSAQGHLLALFLEMRCVPAMVFVRSPLLDKLIAPLAEELGFEINLTEALPELDLAKRDFTENLFERPN